MKLSIVVLLISAFSLSCTIHHAANVANDHHAGSSLTDSLTGTWKLDKIEMPDMVAKIASFGSQEERDAANQKMTTMQDALKGMVVTFSPDGSYLSKYNGQSDIGTWKVYKREIDASSKVTSNVSIFPIISLSGSNLVVKFSQGETDMQMTFLKQ